MQFVSGFSFLLSAFQLFAGPPQLSTLNPQLLCSGNRLLVQRSATATIWDREAGTRVSKVRTDTGTDTGMFFCCNIRPACALLRVSAMGGICSEFLSRNVCYFNADSSVSYPLQHRLSDEQAAI